MVTLVSQFRFAHGLKLSAIKLLGGAALVCLLMSCTTQEDKAFNNAYQAYKALFIDAGRVIDTGNQNVSHSESQGYGMLFSVAANDRQTFDTIWQWTQEVLQREDKLFFWRYVPCDNNDASCIDDPNNASDGDLLIAWALLRAADKWSEERYHKAAVAIITSIESSLIYRTKQHHLLLPGEYGFIHQAEDDPQKNRLQVNLSYWVFPALEAIAKVSTKPSQWRQLITSGTTLIKDARFSSHQLPSDWLGIQGNTFSLAHTLSQDYGFNACRIPLHLAWSQIEAPDVYAAFFAFWRQESPPATVNLVTGETAEYAMTAGMQTLAATVAHLVRQEPVKFAEINRQTDYYSASLIMLSRLAVLDVSS